MAAAGSKKARLWGWRTAATVALAAATTVGLTLPASADVVAENSGVRGRADWTWHRTWLGDVYMGVRDLDCDGNDVYVQLRVTYTNGDHVDTTRHPNKSGCGTAADWSGLSYYANFYIAGVTVISCVDDFGSNTCAYSAYHDNPTT